VPVRRPPASIDYEQHEESGQQEQQAERPAPSPGAARRPPFVFLVVGLLSGGLICLLLLNTVLAAGTFQMTSLQQTNAILARQQQELQQQIAYAESPSAIAQRAKQLGMVPVSQPRFVNLKSGRSNGRQPGLVSPTGN
jgi:Tfp pilus assembly protein PilN